MGCYMGDFTVLFDQHYADLNVIEAADILIKATQKRVSSRVRFIHSTFEAAEISERFDNIFLIHTLEHLDDPVGVMRKAGNWLKPNGRFFVAVPNAHAVSRRIAVKMGLITHNSAITPSESAHGHRITYSLDTLERDVRDSGLSIIDRGGVLFKPLANFQFDQLMGTAALSPEYIEGCYALGMEYPDLCASIFVVCEKTKPHAKLHGHSHLV
jgi:2-polyprenyl-3-methyl-5-hydroxy-6-metoxy-1,4-benzoquinol methylase